MKSVWACQRLNAIGNARTDRIHPIAVLSAYLTYRSGKGARGSNTWTPVPQVVDALDQAFERSFDTAPQTNQRFYLGIDVSGSMGSGEVAGIPGLTPRMAAAAMTMAIARKEPSYYIAGFANGGVGYRVGFMMARATMAPLSITATDSLADAVHKTQGLDFGATDCALPMLDALEKKIPVDVFVILTDSETWAGPVHPAEALRKYRQEMGIPAKLVVVAMVSNGFTIADPEDAGMMDPFLRSRSRASAPRCVRPLLVPFLVLLHNDEQGVKITHPQHLHQPPPQSRRWTPFPPHQLGHVSPGNPAAARQFVLRDVELVQQFPYYLLPELHPD